MDFETFGFIVGSLLTRRMSAKSKKFAGQAWIGMARSAMEEEPAAAVADPTHEAPEWVTPSEYASRRVRREPLPMKSFVIKAGKSFTVTVNPQRPILVDRIVLLDSVGVKTKTVLTDVQIAQKSCFVAAGEIPIRVFHPSAHDTGFRLETVSPGIYLTMSFTNYNDEDVIVHGCLFGETVVL